MDATARTPLRAGEAEAMTRLYMWTIMRKLCCPAIYAPLPAIKESRELIAEAGKSS